MKNKQINTENLIHTCTTSNQVCTLGKEIVNKVMYVQYSSIAYTHGVFPRYTCGYKVNLY